MTATAPLRPFLDRLARARAAMTHLGIDALVVTHLPNLRYLTGFGGSAGLAILTPASCTLLVDFRYVTAARALLDGRGDTDMRLEVAAASYDERLFELLRESGPGRIGIEAAWMPVSRFNRLSALLAPAAPLPRDTGYSCPVLVPTERVVEALRVVKDEGEIAALREGARRLSGVARDARRIVIAGRSEQDVAVDVDAALRAAGFERPAFETIVASGPNSALPHARPTARILQAGEGVVLDFGGVYDGYCVDLTRTVRLGGQPAELRRIFDAVAGAHAEAIRAVRPGVLASEVDAAARAALDRCGLGEFFGHGTGHGLGLDVHEEPRISRPAAGLPDARLEPGMVFTIEPGVYVPGVGGVRIEDDVLVVEAGCEVLTDVPVAL